MAVTINKEDEALGQRLQFYRERARVTQQDIAKDAGLTKNHISSIERGVHKCNAKTFIIYGQKCNVSLDILADMPDRTPMLIELKETISNLDLDQQTKLLEMIKSFQK